MIYLSTQKSRRALLPINTRELEKEMEKRYKRLSKEHTEEVINSALLETQNWAEEYVVKTNGKLTISIENEIQKILDKLRQNHTT